jgi:hypothetical protein
MDELAPRAKKILFKESAPCDISTSETFERRLFLLNFDVTLEVVSKFVNRVQDQGGPLNLTGGIC